MKITVIGSGYVGLVTGACFADMGNHVICVDNNPHKVHALQQGEIPIYEPGLKELVARNSMAGRLHFTTDLCQAVREARVLIIAVGTPPGDDGSADLQSVLEVASGIAEYMDSPKIIVDKSTVPVGTADLVRQTMRDILGKRGVVIPFDVVSNPEFLKEGAAIEDFMKPDRVILGVDDPQSAAVLREMYLPFNRSADRIIVMSIRSAEMAKYAANAMLATKISFMNELSHLCEAMGADIDEVRKGIGSDSRIGNKFIYAGVGYGGSCFPKDVKALIHMQRQAGLEPRIMQAVEDTNALQKTVLVSKVKKHFGIDLKGLTFAVWGLSFKPQTDDMREAPSIVIINALTAAGATVRAFDPVAIREAMQAFSTNNSFYFGTDEYEILTGADAMLLITEWHQFRFPDFAKMRSLMKNPVIFDGRNQYDPLQMKQLGFTCYGIGRG
jgi:UDPglucose 6-dehydrogenase